MIEFGGNFKPFIVASQFATFGLDIRSFREPLKQSIQEVVAPSIRKNFEQGGRPSWEPLSPDTLRIKSAGGWPEDILVRTGKLKRVASQLNSWTITSDEASITQLSGADYGFLHQSGTKNMPAREFLIIQEEDIDKIEQVFDNWITERAIKAGAFSALSGGLF